MKKTAILLAAALMTQMSFSTFAANLVDMTNSRITVDMLDDNNIGIDFSTKSEGFFTVHTKDGEYDSLLVQYYPEGKRNEINVFSFEKDEDMSKNFALNKGDGTYVVEIFSKNKGENYKFVGDTKVDVIMPDHLQVFLQPTYYMDFQNESNLQNIASEIYGNSSSEKEFVQNICNFCSGMTYIDTSSSSVPKNYDTNLDEILENGSGTSLELASLAAAMIRSQGIPCALEMGEFSKDNGSIENHTWINALASDENGNKQWERHDPARRTTGSTEADVQALFLLNRYGVKNIL